MREDYDEIDLNDQFFTECCGAPILGPVNGDIGLCSRCLEWSGVRQEAENEDE